MENSPSAFPACRKRRLKGWSIFSFLEFSWNLKVPKFHFHIWLIFKNFDNLAFLNGITSISTVFFKFEILIRKIDVVLRLLVLIGVQKVIYLSLQLSTEKNQLTTSKPVETTPQLIRFGVISSEMKTQKCLEIILTNRNHKFFVKPDLMPNLFFTA